MAYFADLTPYAYGRRLQLGVVHVGWLDTVHDYPRGEVPKVIIEKLKMLAASPVERYCGYHLCELCEKPEEAQLVSVPDRLGFQPNEAWTRWAAPRMSYGEIRVRRDGVIYAAPMTVAHYIEAHGYLPPSEFLRAVEEAPDPQGEGNGRQPSSSEANPDSTAAASRRSPERSPAKQSASIQDHERLRQRYANLGDEELLELALQGADTLRPEAVELLHNEVALRRFGPEVSEGIHAQLGEFTPAQHAELVEQFRRLPCPLCGERRGPLNAFSVAQARSFLVTIYQKWLVVGCSECIQRAGSKAYRSTIWLGWWGFPPWGIFLTLQALGFSEMARCAGKYVDPTPELLEYVKNNRGSITALLKSDGRLCVETTG